MLWFDGLTSHDHVTLIIDCSVTPCDSTGHCRHIREIVALRFMLIAQIFACVAELSRPCRLRRSQLHAAWGWTSNRLCSSDTSIPFSSASSASLPLLLAQGSEGGGLRRASARGIDAWREGRSAVSFSKSSAGGRDRPLGNDGGEQRWNGPSSTGSTTSAASASKRSNVRPRGDRHRLREGNGSVSTAMTARLPRRHAVSASRINSRVPEAEVEGGLLTYKITRCACSPGDRSRVDSQEVGLHTGSFLRDLRVYNVESIVSTFSNTPHVKMLLPEGAVSISRGPG